MTRSSGQASSGYGRFEQNVVAVTLATPEGELTLGGRTPSSATAAGPKLIDVLIGSEGTLGVITEMTLQLHEGPTEFAYETWAFDSFTDGFDAFRALAQDLGHGVMPDVSRLSDGEESRTILAQSAQGLAAMATFAARGAREPSLGVLRWEDTDRTTLRRRRRQAHRVLRASGARRAPAAIAEHWISHRFRGPYQRDHLMDRGIFVETLETATTWANLPTLYRAVRDAISAEVGPHAVVQCHVSHLYDGGASLYYTFFCREESDPLAQWRRVKTAASDVIAAHGGTITHHHAVGTDHRAWAADEMGELGAQLLAVARERRLDVGLAGDGGPSTATVFLGVATLGYDSMANTYANDAPRAVPSSLVYAYGGARTLVHALPRPLTLVVDGVTHEFTGWNVAIGNSGRFGAGMRVNPDASMSDGLLDVTVVTDIPRWRYPAMLPRLFRGTHVDGVRVRALRGRDIRVITPHVGDVYADGDLLEASPTTFRALPDALRVLVPAP